MTIQVDIIADSISPEGIRLTTYQLLYPRIVHGEVMTHRVFSRNASSSRAVPIKKAIGRILADPAEPVEWGQNQKGMQAGKPLTGWCLAMTKFAWHFGKWAAVIAARIADKAGAHKQIANRLTEPFSHISVVLTATDFENFFVLRNHPDADPTIRELARRMEVLYWQHAPQQLGYNDWHLPYIGDDEREDYANHINGDGTPFLARLSAARCARVSYLTHEGTIPSHARDIALWEQLVENKPVHASPTEHQATPDKLWSRNRWAKAEEHGNLRGWRQHRKMIPGEAVEG